MKKYFRSQNINIKIALISISMLIFSSYFMTLAIEDATDSIEISDVSIIKSINASPLIAISDIFSHSFKPLLNSLFEIQFIKTPLLNDNVILVFFNFRGPPAKAA